MRLLINTASTFKGGGVQVAKSFIEEAVQFTEHEYHVVLGRAISNVVDQKKYPSNFFFYNIPYRPATRVFSLKSPHIFLSSLEKRIKPDCVFTTSGPAYWRPKAPHLMGFNLPHYIYPDSPFFAKLNLRDRLYWALKGVVIKYYTKRDADAYVVQTDDVNVRLGKWIDRRDIHTVTNTYGGHFDQAIAGNPVLPDRRDGEFRFLMLSAWYKHKNFEIINDVCDLIFEQKLDHVRFVVTLPGEIYEKMFSANARKYIHNTGPLKPEQCPCLYKECHAIFLPTLLECFSATYAEAMRMEKPIITSDLGFARSVCGDSALYFDPLNAPDILGKILLLMSSHQLRQELVLKGRHMLGYFLQPSQRAGRYIEISQYLSKSHLSVTRA